VNIRSCRTVYVIITKDINGNACGMSQVVTWKGCTLVECVYTVLVYSISVAKYVH
jgi:hypothetical protein